MGKNRRLKLGPMTLEQYLLQEMGYIISSRKDTARVRALAVASTIRRVPLTTDLAELKATFRIMMRKFGDIKHNGAFTTKERSEIYGARTALREQVAQSVGPSRRSANAGAAASEQVALS